MAIDCCKSYVGKQIIGLLPGGAEECLYVLAINAQDYGVADFFGWTLNGNNFITELANYGTVIQYQNDTGNYSVYVYYTGTEPTDLNVSTTGGDVLFTIRKVTDFEGGSCDYVCYQASFDYGYQWRFIDFFSTGTASPYFSTGFPYNIDDATNLQYFASSFLGPQITVTSVWNGSQYVVTINNAFNLGGFQLGDGAPVYTAFTALPCEIVPPEPVSLFVLDVYPGATAAYGMRKLSSTYTGAAFRVRRSSDNTEQDIGFSGINVDVSALSFFVGANNGFITRWYDQTGQSREFGQLNASLQPRIVNAGVIDMANGIPSIFFGEAAIKYMETFNPSEPAFDFTNTYSIYIAAKPANQAGDQVIFGKGTGLFGQTGYYISTGNSQSYLINNNSTTTPNFSALINNNSIALSCYGFNLSSGNGSSSFNGSIINNYTGLISARLNNFNPIIGVYQTNSNTNDFDGWFSEMIIYPIDQSANRTGIETNIKNYYSI